MPGACRSSLFPLISRSIGHGRGTRGHGDRHQHHTSVACEPHKAAWGGCALFKYHREIVQCRALALVRALFFQAGHFDECCCGFLLVHHSVSVEIDGWKATRDAEIVKRPKRVGQRLAVPVAASQERCACLLPVARRASRVQFHSDSHARIMPVVTVPARGYRRSAMDRDLVDDLAVCCGHHDVRRLHGLALVAVVRPPDMRHECGLLDAE